MTLWFCCLPNGLYLVSPQEPPQKKSYRHAQMLPVCRRMSRIHSMFASPRAHVLWRRRYQVTLAQLWRMEDPLTSPTQSVTEIKCTKLEDIGVMTSRMIGSVKLDLILLRNVSETKVTVQAVPQAKTFHSKGRHSTVSPKELSDQWQIGLKQAWGTITKKNTNNHLICCNAPSEAI